MRQVFISYSSREYSQANEIVRALEDQGIQCWIAPRNIGIGSNYMRDIPGGIRECPFFLLVLSRNSQDSIWVEKELGQAIKQRREIFPLLIENCAICDGFDFLLDNVQIRPYYRDKNAVLQEIITRIQGEPPQKASASQPPELPAEECNRKGDDAYYTENYTEAVKWYRKAAEQGYAIAQYNLGLCYRHGHGVNQNWHEAARLYRLAADQGEPDAQCRLGWCYENGLGVPQDNKACAEWYRKAADQGNSTAQYNLGQCYGYSRGVKQDWNEAVRLYRLAADQDYAYAQSKLGWCYEYGNGVPKDLIAAIMWYQKAADQGDEYAQNALNRLK